MRTYFVLGRRISRAWRTGRGSGQTNNSLAEVVYGMVRARRRRTMKRLVISSILGSGRFNYLGIGTRRFRASSRV